MNEKLTRKQMLEGLKASILGQLNVSRLIKNTDKDFTLSVPIVEGSNIGIDDVISILNEIYEPQQVPEIVAVNTFSSIGTNSTILTQLRKK